jgi:dienelactone hydrolase
MRRESHAVSFAAARLSSSTAKPVQGAGVAEVLLLHHALGLTPGIQQFAARLRECGHVVHTPDLYAGQSFTTIEEGMADAQQIGFPEGIIAAGEQVAESLPEELVYVGFSLGVLPAQKLAQSRPGARGAVLVYSCVPLGFFGDSWPAGVPVQVHGMDEDPIFAGEGDLDAARSLVESSPDAQLFLYPGDQHYFAEPGLASYRPEAAEGLTRRIQDFLAARS